MNRIDEERAALERMRHILAEFHACTPAQYVAEVERLLPGMPAIARTLLAVEALAAICPHCAGTGEVEEIGGEIDEHRTVACECLEES